ncbi:hypothetical protein ACMXYV_13705 [Neptuniibacter sp. SY11_33]|uniref:hypothetical protein n=1 Tax=Neptuniibacter sp. SY11_33 TaxID=3398215 RepID=UPI0039F463A7
MRFVLLSLCMLSSISTSLADVLQDQRGIYKSVNLVQFVNKNQLSTQMAEKKQRLMIQPEPIQFQAQLMSMPKAGKFSLAYDALQLWQSESELPTIDHSAFVGLQEGPVLGVYVTHEAAKMLRQINLEVPTQFYAMHIYNYSKGPRLVIVAAQEKPQD